MKTLPSLTIYNLYTLDQKKQLLNQLLKPHEVLLVYGELNLVTDTYDDYKYGTTFALTKVHGRTTYYYRIDNIVISLGVASNPYSRPYWYSWFKSRNCQRPDNKIIEQIIDNYIRKCYRRTQLS